MLGKAKSSVLTVSFNVPIEWSEFFNGFDWIKERLDIIYHNIIGSREKCQELWKICQIIFYLPLQRLVSLSMETFQSKTTSEFSVESLKEISLVTQNTVFDDITTESGILNIDITSNNIDIDINCDNVKEEDQKEAK